MISERLKQQLKAATIAAYPREACGLIVGDIYIPIDNMSARPDDGFVMCPIQLSEALERFEPTAIFHSHPDDTARPSQHDLARIDRADTPLPWVIMSWPEYDITITYPQAPAKLIGREFVHGVQDCYTLIQDFYSAKLGITLSQYHRDDEWWEKGQDLYLDNYKDEGFYEVPLSDIQYGDFILMQVESNTVNHAAIYIGDGQILHHIYGRLSKRGIYGGYWLDRTRRILRHKLYNTDNVKQLTESDDANNNQAQRVTSPTLRP